jgi:hypothetical protein
MRAVNARRVVAVVPVALALCLMLYHEVRAIAPLQTHSAETFAAHKLGIRFPVTESDLGRMDLDRSWRPRVLSNRLGSLAVGGAISGGEIDPRTFAHLAGLYSALWLALVFLVYSFFLREKALIAVLGTFAAVAFGYMPGIADRVYPWDMPALFFYVLFVCLLIRRRSELFLAALPIGVLFKETVGVLALAYLFVEGTRRRRLELFGAALILSVAARAAAGWIAHSMPGSAPSFPLLVANLRFIVTGDFPYKEWYRWVSFWNHPLLLDAGLLLAFLLHPFRDANTRMLRVLVGVFAVGNLLSGIVFEFRIWFELIPVFLYPFLQPVDSLRISPDRTERSRGGARSVPG